MPSNIKLIPLFLSIFDAITGTNNYSNNNSEHFDNISVHRNVHTSSTSISRLHMQQFHINKPTFKPTFYANEKKSPKELLSPQIIFIFIEGSPVNKSVKYQNRGTMGVQIPFSFPKGLDFKPFQAKVRVLPWQINNTFILPILSPHIFSKHCKYWLSSLYTLFSKTAFFS